MDRKSSAKRGKGQYYDRRRKGEEDWSKGTVSYGPKTKKKYGGRYDSRDYDYQYIHKDRRQYNRDELLKLAGKATINGDTLEQLTLKYDLVFSEEMRKPIGDIDESKEDRFVESTNDGETPTRDRRDDYEYQERDRGRSDRYRERDQPSRDIESKGFQRKKEFVRFDDLNDSAEFDKVDSYLEKKCKERREDDEDLPAWATEDYEGEVPAWSKIETKEILQQTENGDKWANLNMKTLDKNEVKQRMAERGDSRSRSDEDRGHYDNDDDQYSAEKKNQNYKFFEEFDDDDEDDYRQNDQANRKASKSSQESGNLGVGGVEDITSLWKKMRQEEEEEQQKKDDDEDYYESEVLNANFYEEELMEKRRELGMKTSPPNSGANWGNHQMTKPSLVDDLFGGINTGQKYGGPPPSQSQFQVSNLNSLLGAFTAGSNGMPIEKPSQPPRIDSNLIAGPQEDIDLIVGPPPSVAKQQPAEHDEKKEKSKKEFQEKYFAMDKALNQIVYDALNSRRRHAIDANSTNGVNQISVEKYCANNYKIFSFLMQGDVFSKVWFYKDKVGNVQGPYMSFDMDIWNGEGVYFSKNLAISPNKKDYFPLAKYLERDNEMLEIVQDVVEKVEKGMDQQSQSPMMMKVMYTPPYGNWVPPQIMQGQIPLIPYNKNSNPQMHGQQHGNNRRRGNEGQSKRGGNSYYNGHNQYKKVETNYVPVSSVPTSEPEPQSEMTSNLRDLLGLPNDPAIQHDAPIRVMQDSRQTPASSATKTAPTPKSHGKNVDNDFPSLSESYKK